MTVPAILEVPERSGSREQARDLLAQLPEDLFGGEVDIDCAGVFVATASFLDEVVKIILCERSAALLRLLNAPDRTAFYTARAARNRGVADRLEVVV